MFHVNKSKLLKEEKETGAVNIKYYLGTCLTCEHSPDRPMRAACPRADFFSVLSQFSSSGNIKIKKHLCSSWELCSEILSCFKKNQNIETQIPAQNDSKGKFYKNHKYK